MWLWIFGILIILAVWVVWLMFPPVEDGGTEFLPLWLAITITAVILGLLIGLWAIRRVRAARAARALERAIAQQAQEQAIASPKDREEIQALYKQVDEGIQALKKSKLAGGKYGEHALYALPWYAIVGPPGAGKTTALRHSGLQFPFLDPANGGVRGVGGTRNCDWWFTNEAIILDTAGRYTTETDDHDEWVAFLEQLMKYRPEKPLNGVFVAISVTELLDATEDQIRTVASKVRARIDEMQTTLKMTLPIYVLFTKSDLVAGFVEYFGDMKKSERGQMWGSTFNLAEPKAEPGRLFDREFDLLVEHLHGRVTKRVSGERNRAVKERIYQFPLEFAAIKRNLSEFMQATFTPGSAQSPILRGFYFTSGTQEGKPLDRVVGAMGKAFGLKGTVQEDTEQSKEARSYFLRDVFLKVAFPDSEIAAMSAAELRRRLMQKLVVAVAAIMLAAVFVIPGVYSYMNNRELVTETRRIGTGVGTVQWQDSSSAYDKVQRLDETRDQLKKLKDWKDNGKPIEYSWFMYQGENLYVPLRDLYIKNLEQGFVKPTKADLELRVAEIKGDPYLPDYNNLKTYLLLDDAARLKDAEIFNFQVGRLTQLWAEVLVRGGGGMSEQDLKAKLQPHVKFYVELQRDAEIPGLTRDPKLVESAREKLRSADRVKAYYDIFITARMDEKIDELGPDDVFNRKFPPIALTDVFDDRPEVQTILSSKSGKQGRTPKEIRGAFTYDAFLVIDKLLEEEGAKLLEREAWVVPYDRDEKEQGATIKKNLKRVRQRYEDEYISEWKEFFRDIDVKIPEVNSEAIAEYKILSTPEWAYGRLLQTLSDNTQFPDTGKIPGGLREDGGVVDQIERRIKRRFESASGVRVDELQQNRDITSKERIKRAFANVVSFGVPIPYVPPKAALDGTKPPEKPRPDPELSKYVGHLEKLKTEMQIVEEGPAESDTIKATELFTVAVKDAETMLLKLDPLGQEMMSELILNPLRQGYRAFIKGAGGAASGLWEVMVWPHYRDKIKDRYPFNLAAKRDASFDDAKTFFKPKEGILWGFYEKYLTSFHRKQDHKFIPMAYLQGEGAKGKPFTPFNPLMYNCLERADEITDALWPSGAGEDPGVKFQINLKTVSPIVSDIVFELDGQKRLYRNEKEFWYSFNWPGEEQTGARIQIRGAGGLDEEITREGPWGIFRLFESADTFTAVKDSDQQFIVTWTMSAPPVTVTMQVRPKRGNHPFPLSFFRATNCPPSIGDKFGGPKQ